MSQSVSVVIAAFNAAPFIAQAAASALSQSGVDLEVIVVDDASHDDTCAIIEGIDDPRLRLLRLPKNQGPAAARNLGLAEAKSDWIAVLDADDAMEPHRLSRLAALGAAGGADIVADNVRIRAPGRPERLFIDEALDDGAQQVDLIAYCDQNHLFDTPTPLGYLKPIFRRAFLHDQGLAYEPGLRIGEDYQLVLAALTRGAIFLRQRSAGYIYQTREGSLSHRMTADHVMAMARAEGALLEASRERLTADQAAAIERRLRSLAKGRAYIEAMDHLKRGRVIAAGQAVLRRPDALSHFWMPVRDRLARRRSTGAMASQD